MGAEATFLVYSVCSVKRVFILSQKKRKPEVQAMTDFPLARLKVFVADWCRLFWPNYGQAWA